MLWRSFFILLSVCNLLATTNAQSLQSFGTNKFVCPPCNRKCDALLFDKPGICEHCNMKLIPQENLKQMPQPERTKVGFYLQSGVEILDLAGPMEVFAYAGYEVFTISKSKEPIYAQGILTVIPDYDITNAPDADILVFFGGNAVLPSKDKELIDWVKSRKETEYFFSVCSGVLILAESGVLDNKQATTFRYTLDTLEKNYPKVEVLRGVRYVDNGKIITTAGVSAGIDGALHMVAKLEGLYVAATTALYMEYDWVPDKGIAYPKDNPYLSMRNVRILEEYEGRFKANTEKEIELELDHIHNELSLVLNNRKYPVFFVGNDKFLTSHASHLLTFNRNKNDKIVSLTTTEFKQKFYKQRP